MDIKYKENNKLSKNNYKEHRFWRLSYSRYPKDLFDFFLSTKKKNLINKKTKIACMGSCFADQIATTLTKRNYNVLDEKEEDKRGFDPVAWGSVYNPACFKQIMDYSFNFGEFSPLTRWWPTQKKEIVMDPFRRNIYYKETQKEKKFKAHSEESKKVLSNLDVFIFTLGLTETWRDKRDHYTFWMAPPPLAYDKSIHEFKNLTVEECTENMKQGLNTLFDHNPNCQVILTVSPVPFRATFENSMDPVTANMSSKSKLRTSINYLIDKFSNVSYFPAFECVLYYPGKAFKDDGRHVEQKTVNKIMNVFFTMYRQ